MKIFDIVPKKMPTRGAPPEPDLYAPKPPEALPEPEPTPSDHPAEPAATLDEFGPADAREEDRIGTQRLQKIGAFTKKENRPPLFEELRARVRRRLVGPTWLVLAGIAALGIIGALTFLYPRVTVAVTAKRLEVPVEVFVTMDGKRQDALPKEGKIRGKLFSFTEETTRTFPTTGKDKVVAKAQGTITIFNAFSAKPQALVATTRFESPDGKIFRLVKAVAVPGATVANGSTKPASVAAEVQADQPGALYNIGPADFTIPGFKGTSKFTGFYAKSYAPMKGGAEGHTVVATEDDLAGARRVLREELTAMLAEKLNQSLLEGWTTLPESSKYEIVAATPSISPGTAADNFQMHFKLSLAAMSYPESELEALIQERLKDIPMDIPSETSNARIESVRADEPRLEESKQLFSGLLKVIVKVEARLDKDALKREILGKRETALKEYLRDHESIQTVKVTFWPFWVKRVPRRDGLVTVTID
jgi:hypothetical protein